MIPYDAPVRDMQFVINELVGIERVASLAVFKDHEINPELVDAVLDEAARLAGEVLAPLNTAGDRLGAQLSADGVTAVAGFKDAYQQFIDGGWNGLAAAPEYEGQGLPELINVATQEMWNASNMSFALCPLLTAGAVEAVKSHASEHLKEHYLAKMVKGEWAGTMNLTEPQAGSDLSAVRSKAFPDGEHYKIKGQKIFITWGDHDMAENIVHLVLARTPDAPEGVKGISLFIVPKYLLNDDGSVGEQNDVHCASIEHKIGIHASPTCVMAYGDNEGAIGYLVGEENQGLACMFTMMNEARLRVGLQGLAIGDRAYQQAREFAKTRTQGRPVGIKHGERVSIISHPDVRRMLLTMKAQNEAMRALCYQVAQTMDIARQHPNADERRANQARVDLLIPVIKGWCTEVGLELTSIGVQVHGGMGFVEETGAAQHYRDARILPIYEGTSGIQAADLVGRKLMQDRGQALQALLTDMRATQTSLAGADDEYLPAIGKTFGKAVQSLADAGDCLLAAMQKDPNDGLAVSFNFLMLMGYVSGGWQMARAAAIASERLAAGDNSGFYEAKLITARFYIEQILPKALMLASAVQAGGHPALALAEEQF